MVDTMEKSEWQSEPVLYLVAVCLPVPHIGKFDDTDGSLKSFPFRLRALL